MMIRWNPLTVRGWAFGLSAGLVALGAGAGTRADEPKGAAPSAESVLRRMTDYYAKVKSFTVDIDREQNIGPMAIKGTMAVAVEQPARIAVRASVAGMDLICDGKTMTTTITPLKKYIQSKAPAAIAAMSTDPEIMPVFVSSLQGSMIGELTSADPYKSVLDGVTSSTYAGIDDVGGVKAHHVKATQDQFDWEVWVAVEGNPLLLKTTIDLSKAAGDQLQGQKYTVVQTFKNWKVDAPIDPKTFTFEPPAGFTKAKDLQDAITGAMPGGGAGGAAMQEPTSPLVGKPAPAISLKTLDGGEFKLKDQMGKQVVMVDFWATWCPPCVKELPILTEVAEAYKDKGVTFIGVDLRESTDKITKFQEDKKLKFAVALDTDGAVGTSYNAEAIPMLVLVDKKGIVQAVHVGYNPAIRETLTKELDAILGGKSLKEEAVKMAKQEEAKTEGLERVWSADGPYVSVAVSPKGAVYAAQHKGTCDVLDLDGKMTRSFAMKAAVPGATVQVARQAGGEDALIAFRIWGPAVAAVKTDGSKLWEEASGQGVDDVRVADLDGDGVDEVIVGYNGGTGLHLFGADGKRLWKRTDLGNVWNVTAADLNGDGKPEVVTTSAQGKVHVTSATDGKSIKDHDVGIYANKIRTAPGQARSPAKGDIVLVAGTKVPNEGEMVLALGGDGTTLWTTKIPSAVHSMAVSPDGSRAAVGFQTGQVSLIDVATGQIIGQVTNQGRAPGLAWLGREGGSDSLLLIASQNAVTAFRPKAGAPANP